MKINGIACLLLSGLILGGCAGANVIDEAVPQAAFGEAGSLPPPGEEPPAEDVAAVPAAKPGTGIDAMAAQPNPDAEPMLQSSGQARITGSYPNINNEPRGATPQMTDADRELLLVQMQALSADHERGLVSSADYRRRLAELRNLAATHSAATLKIIEK